MFNFAGHGTTSGHALFVSSARGSGDVGGKIDGSSTWRNYPAIASPDPSQPYNDLNIAAPDIPNLPGVSLFQAIACEGSLNAEGSPTNYVSSSANIADYVALHKGALNSIGFKLSVLHGTDLVGKIANNPGGDPYQLWFNTIYRDALPYRNFTGRDTLVYAQSVFQSEVEERGWKPIVGFTPLYGFDTWVLGRPDEPLTDP